jgi:hypothetical protein
MRSACQHPASAWRSRPESPRKIANRELPSDIRRVLPIEQAFAKYEALLRKAAERTVEGLWQTIGRIADLFSPAECRNFFNSAGYAT